MDMLTVLTRTDGPRLLSSLLSSLLPGGGGARALTEDLTALGMQHYWPLTESSGAVDEIGGTTTTEEGAPDRTQADVYDEGFSVDCDGSHLNLIRTTTPTFTGDFTYGLWYKPQITTDVSLYGKNGSNDNYILRRNTNIAAQSLTGSTVRTWTAPTIVLGEWEHILISRISGVAEAYYNGTKLAGGGALTGSYDNDLIGRYGGSTLASNGPICHVFSGAVGLTEAQVTDLWASTLAP